MTRTIPAEEIPPPLLRFYGISLSTSSSGDRSDVDDSAGVEVDGAAAARAAANFSRRASTSAW